MDNESLKGNINIINGMNWSSQYLLLALVDYKTAPFYVNGTNSVTHLMNLSPMETKYYPFEIKNLSQGYHDVMLLTFLDPYQHSLNKEYRFHTDGIKMGSRRFNVIVGNGTAPTIEYKNNTNSYDESNPLDSLLVNKEQVSLKAWLSENTTANKQLDYFIHVGNKYQEYRTFAVIQFLDYEQIPINYNGLDYVYYGSLNKSENCYIPATVVTPNVMGVHELVTVWISDPYEKIETSPGIRNTNITGSVEPSIRIGLNVIA